jgi:hypothetical protein
MEKKEKCALNWVWWLPPIILAIWKVEIRRVVVEGQSGEKASETPPPQLTSLPS